MMTDFQKENCVTITKITETTNLDGVRVVRKEHVNPKTGEVLEVEIQEYLPEVNKKDEQGLEEVVLQEYYPPSPHHGHKPVNNEIESQLPPVATSTIPTDQGQNKEDKEDDKKDKKKRLIILAVVIVAIVLILIIALAVGLGGGDDDYEYYGYEGGGGYSNGPSSNYGNSDDSSDDDKGKWMYCSVSSSCYNYATGYYESCTKSEYVYRPAGYC